MGIAEPRSMRGSCGTANCHKPIDGCWCYYCGRRIEGKSDPCEHFNTKAVCRQDCWFYTDKMSQQEKDDIVYAYELARRY